MPAHVTNTLLLVASRPHPNPFRDSLIARRMLIDDDYLSYSSIDYANNLICEPFTGEVSVTPIYNMSIYSANGMTEEAVDTDGVSDVKHKNAYSMADVAFTTTTTGTPLVTSDIDLVLSTNVNLFNSSSTWSVAVDTTASALDTSDPKVQHWVLTLTPGEAKRRA